MKTHRHPRMTTGDYVVEREEAPEFFEGRPVRVAGPVLFQTGPSVFRRGPGATIKVLPEGTLAENFATLLTSAMLRAEPVADVVIVDGERWQVQRIEAAHLGGGHQLVPLERQLK